MALQVKTISRSEVDYLPETWNDRVRIKRNFDPSLQRFAHAREYTRALTAVKLEKMFAKPFTADLKGHLDGVFTMAKHPTRLSTLISGSCDGDIRVWNLSTRSTLWNVYGHKGFVRGLAFHSSGKNFVSCGDDQRICVWQTDKVQETNSMEVEQNQSNTPTPITTIQVAHGLRAIDFQRQSDLFATAGNEVVEIWDINRTSATKSFSWGVDTVTSVRFNPAELDIFASTGTDRSIALYDLRGATVLRKVIMNMRSNALCWNPMQPIYFTAANEDNNLYTFDMRKLNEALRVHSSHVSAVLDVDYSPTGKEFCSGSYDRTVRIFNVNSAKSREVYHTKRMQRIFCVRFTPDAKYVLTGSDDMNIRIWKANASNPVGTMAKRKQLALNYMQSLRERYKYHKEIRTIAKHRHLPAQIYKSLEEQKVQREAADRRLVNRIRHSAPGSVQVPKQTKAHIVKELE